MDTESYTYEALQQKYGNFLAPALEITIGTKQYSSNEIPILNLEIELTADGTASGCSFTVDGQYKAQESCWRNDFGKQVKLGAKLIVKGGYVAKKELFYGYIDDYSFQFSGHEGPYIHISGLDGLGYLMSMREPIYAGQKKPAELVKSILNKSVSAGFAKKVTVGTLNGFATPVLKEQVDDWTFLNLLAGRYGATLFAVDGELIFDSIVSRTTPILTLTGGVNLRSFTKRVSLAHQVGKVEVWGRDVNHKAIKGSADQVTVGGSGRSAAQLVPGLKKAVMREYSEFVRTEAECKLLAQNRLNGLAMGLVSGEGSCIGIPELIPGRYLQIKGLDANSNGTYFISRVRHRFDADGYSTAFEIKGARTE